MNNSHLSLRVWAEVHQSKDTYFYSLPKDINDLVGEYIVDELLFIQVNDGSGIDSYINDSLYSMPTRHICHTAYGTKVITEDYDNQLIELDLVGGVKQKFINHMRSDRSIDSPTGVTHVNRGWLIYYDNSSSNLCIQNNQLDQGSPSSQKQSSHNCDAYYYRSLSSSQGFYDPIKLDGFPSGQLLLDRSTDDNRHQVSMFRYDNNLTHLVIYDLYKQQSLYSLLCSKLYHNYCNLIMYKNNIYYQRDQMIIYIDLRSNSVTWMKDDIHPNAIIPYKQSFMKLHYLGLHFSVGKIINESIYQHVDEGAYKKTSMYSSNTVFVHSLSYL